MDFSSPVKRIKKKISRKLSFKGLSSSVEGKSRDNSIDCDSSEDSLAKKYGVDLSQLRVELKKELSKGSDDESSCWTPDKIMDLVDSLRIPLELLVKIIQAVKQSFN